MHQDSDSKDKKEARSLAIVLIGLLLVLGIAAALALPIVSAMAATHFAPGLGLKDAAAIAFAITTVLMIIFAVAAGDGFIGEIQFMLLGFFAFFVVIWLMMAWVF
jgi:hypothetical protein